MPCPFTGPKMFWGSPNFLSQPKNLTAFSACSKNFVPAQKPILLNANHLFVWHKMFATATICKQIFGLAQNIWTSPKHFGTCKRTRHKYLFKFGEFCGPLRIYELYQRFISSYVMWTIVIAICVSYDGQTRKVIFWTKNIYLVVETCL